jgi:ABC-type amino acid transport substrate-binding protein
MTAPALGCEMRVGARRGTTAEAYVLADGTAAATRLSESNDELYAALRDRTIDAVVDDSPIAGYSSRTEPGLRMCGMVPETDGAYAVMLRKGNSALRSVLDAALDTLTSDGTLGTLKERWLAAGGRADSER